MPVREREPRAQTPEETSAETTAAPSGSPSTRATLWRWLCTALPVAGGLALVAAAVAVYRAPKGPAPTALETQPICALGTRTYNLASDGRTLRISVVVEAEEAAFCRVIKQQEAMLADVLLEIVSNKRLEDLDTRMERNRLRREILDEFNEALGEPTHRLTNVYFTEFYYQ